MKFTTQMGRQNKEIKENNKDNFSTKQIFNRLQSNSDHRIQISINAANKLRHDRKKNLFSGSKNVLSMRKIKHGYLGETLKGKRRMKNKIKYNHTHR